MHLANRTGGGGTPALGSLHLTPHHLIFLSEGENELWVRCPFKVGALDAGVGWCHASEGQ